jgi:hypothetical protein
MGERRRDDDRGDKNEPGDNMGRGSGQPNMGKNRGHGGDSNRAGQGQQQQTNIGTGQDQQNEKFGHYPGKDAGSERDETDVD